MNKSEITKIINDYMSLHGLFAKGWTFSWNSRKSSWGLCNYGKRKIQLSEVLFSPDVKKEQVENSILNLIAHALTPGHMHDETWQRKCHEIGCTPMRTATFEGKPDYKWGIFFEDELIKGYHRKPSETVFQKLPRLYVKEIGRQKSQGKLKIEQIKK